MTQLKAMLYKNTLLLVRRRTLCAYQFLTPIFGLIVVLIAKTIGRSMYSVDYAKRIVPTYLYEAGIPQNLRVMDEIASHPEFEACEQIYEYSYLAGTTTGTMANFSQVLSSAPKEFTGVCHNKLNPEWRYSGFLNENDQNSRLIKDIMYLNRVKRSDLAKDSTLPDGSVLVRSLTQRGMNLNLMVNNLIYWSYHRPNGVTAIKYKLKGSEGSQKVYSVTEGYLSMMNLLSNSYLNRGSKQDKRHIMSFVSMTTESNQEKGFVASLLGFIETVVFPVSLSLGLPIMLYSLVMEKEEGIKSLLDIMGLQAKNYWKGFIYFHILVCAFSNTLFYFAGKIIVGGAFFKKGNVILMMVQLFGWDLSQIGMALFLSNLIDNKKIALYLGYTINFFLIIVIGNLSVFFFAFPSTLPKLFYLIPHSCVVRGIYYQVRACVESDCNNSLSSLNMEQWFNLVLPYFHFAFYFLVGLSYFDNRMYSKVTAAIKFNKSAKKLQEIEKALDLSIVRATHEASFSADPSGRDKAVELQPAIQTQLCASVLEEELYGDPLEGIRTSIELKDQYVNT